jgi:hypothetical protein
MMSLVVEGIVNLLAAAPAVVPAGRIGDRAPSAPGDLPSVSVSLALDPPRGNGVGQFLREAHQVTQHTAVTEVTTVGDAPFTDLQTLRILPLPLKRNPASHSEGFSSADVMVRRVAGGGNPVEYRMVTRPATREEFALDAVAALIRFGAPQVAGDTLEVVHWTAAFRDDIVSVRYSGTMDLDVWAKDSNETSSLARGVQRMLSGAREELRSRGFAKLVPAGLRAAGALQQPGSGSAFAAWRQTLTYRFAFEAELGGEASSGGAIQRIDVHANGQLQETFGVPGTR